MIKTESTTGFKERLARAQGFEGAALCSCRTFSNVEGTCGGSGACNAVCEVPEGLNKALLRGCIGLSTSTTLNIGARWCEACSKTLGTRDEGGGAVEGVGGACSVGSCVCDGRGGRSEL